ncbi:MAG: DUF454 domain-containing protein [Clostridia bacterium]|jgi:uncharacterized membrane protein YbaN (DUF454 family)|nr:DUF454 domain-containing protein [Clostridia bacterium]
MAENIGAIKRILLIIIGSLSLGLGIIGIFLPVLPTTPFLLLALACYLRSNKKLYNFILTNKYMGPYVKDYVSGNGIPLRMKKRAIVILWITIGFSSVFIVKDILVRIILVAIACMVSFYIWTRKSPEDIPRGK